MKHEILSEGVVSRREPGTPTAAAHGPRCAVTRSGQVVCVFAAQAELGKNDFRPLMARSADGGLSWSAARDIWPEEVYKRHSVYVNLSAAPSGDLILTGFRTPVDVPGEASWSTVTSGLKANELAWSRSGDEGATWEKLRSIPMPVNGSAEPGAMCATRAGGLVFGFSPYNTFDPRLVVERNRLICMRSGDGGRSWSHSPMLRFPDPESHGAEAWIVELSDGRLLGASWHLREGADPPNAYALSLDGGATWGETRSTGFRGQASAMAPLPGGRVLFVYNQRKFGDIGVWMAVAEPTEKDFGVVHHERIWAAAVGAKDPAKPNANDLKAWTGFAFGGPAPAVLADGSILVTFWSGQSSACEIRYVKLRLE
jgi:hypothetical protein